MRSPSKSLELVIEEDDAFFEVVEPTIKLESLRGGEPDNSDCPITRNS